MEKQPAYNFFKYLQRTSSRIRVPMPRWFIIATLSLLALVKFGLIDFLFTVALFTGMYYFDYHMSKPKAEKEFLEEWKKEHPQ